MQHLLGIKDFSRVELEQLIALALDFKYQRQIPPNYQDREMANLFYENSTRTRVSFELAAKRLQMPVINLDINRSSVEKGETLIDTVLNLEAMGINAMVLRHPDANAAHEIARHVTRTHIINAGTGTTDHPSQALLDYMTILEAKGSLDKLKIAIIGDLRHSRVANSFQQLATLCNPQELVMVAPQGWQPETITYGTVITRLADALKDADVIMALRIQHERLAKDEIVSLAEYQANYTITPKLLQLAKKDAILMHPGPINHGVELTADLVSAQQAVIMQQVTNGVFMRMAILQHLLAKDHIA